VTIEGQSGQPACPCFLPQPTLVNLNLTLLLSEL